MPALEDIKYDTLPAHMQEPIRLYIEEGRPLGDFLQSLLCNKLMQTFRHADAKNLAAIHEWLSFVYNEVPGDACGSEEAYEYWCDVGGYNSHFSLLRMKALAREKGIELSEEELKIAILSIGKKIQQTRRPASRVELDRSVGYVRQTRSDLLQEAARPRRHHPRGRTRPKVLGDQPCHTSSRLSVPTNDTPLATTVSTNSARHIRKATAKSAG